MLGVRQHFHTLVQWNMHIYKLTRQQWKEINNKGKIKARNKEDNFTAVKGREMSITPNRTQ